VIVHTFAPFGGVEPVAGAGVGAAFAAGAAASNPAPTPKATRSEDTLRRIRTVLHALRQPCGRVIGAR
jgi:hypothetical protein